MKKRLVFIIISLIFLSCFFGRFDITQCAFTVNYTCAETEDDDLESQLSEEVEKQLSHLDFDGLETELSKLSSQAKKLFESDSFKDKLNYVLSGEYADNSKTFFEAVVSIFWGNFKEFLPLISIIVSVSILGGMVFSLQPMSQKNSLSNIVHFVTYGVILVILGATITKLISMAKSTLDSVNGVFSNIFPILLTLLSAVGGSVSVGIYQPAIGFLGNVFVNLSTFVLLPMFIFSIVFSIVGNLSNNVKLDKFVDFLQGSFKWCIGLLFTVFLSFVSIQGIMAGSIDGLSIRTAKYAIKSYVPIVGGYVSDGLSIILASSSLIKNAVGGVGLFLLLSIAISPVISIVLFMISLKFMAGIIEPIGDKKIANFVSSLSKSMSLLIGLIVSVCFMYFVLTGLIMCSANLI